MRFTWDPKKRQKVKADHRIDFARIADVFHDSYALEYSDEEHSDENDVRFGIVGMTASYGLIHLIFTEPSEDEVHFITVRKAEKWWANFYDKEKSRI